MSRPVHCIVRSQAIIYPLELIRTRLAVSPDGTYRGISHCVSEVLRHEGWRAFYRGMMPSMVCRCSFSLDRQSRRHVANAEVSLAAVDKHS